MVTSYIEGTLTDQECIDFLKHVKKCPACHEELETYFIVDYALQFLDEEGSDRSFDMQKVLKDDIRWNETRILKTRMIRGITLGGMVLSDILLLITAIIKFNPSVAKAITDHISILFHG
jgi:hypothetical protein